MGKISHVHGLENSTLKMRTIPEVIYRLNSISVKKKKVSYFAEMEKTNPQIHIELQEAPNSQNNIDKEK